MSDTGSNKNFNNEVLEDNIVTSSSTKNKRDMEYMVTNNQKIEQNKKLKTEHDKTETQKYSDEDSSAVKSFNSTISHQLNTSNVSKQDTQDEVKVDNQNQKDSSTTLAPQEDIKFSSVIEVRKDNSTNDDALPLLIGSYNVEYGIATWEGDWAFSEEAFTRGNSSKFRFRSRATPGSVALKGPVNGIYDGFFGFKVQGRVTKKVEEKGLQLTFTHDPQDPRLYKVNGEGSNKFGRFVLQGEYDQSQSKLRVTKSYIS